MNTALTMIGNPPNLLRVAISQYVPMKFDKVPARSPSLKASHGDLFSIDSNRGIRSTHARIHA